jgi:lactoylglutathione lyase
MESWPKAISAVTLFVEDLKAAKAFYERTFGLPIHFEDDVSAVFNFGNALVNLLQADAARELVTPAPVASPDAGARIQFTIDLNGPMDRPWGIRTASFRDPGGHIWEIAK